MTRLTIRTPSRLHFGLLSWGSHSSRQCGGVGLMVDKPGIEITATASSRWQAEGPLASRVLEVAERVAERLTRSGAGVMPGHFHVLHAPREHVGLGVGTQLSLAVARLVATLANLPVPIAETLAAWTARGQRSGIGLHGFVHGGLIVDGGRRAEGGIPPLLAHVPFPSDWSILLVLPNLIQGLHGSEEARAFSQLPPISERSTDRLCRLVLLGLLPAVVEHDLETFGAALTELQQQVGRWFSPFQGGTYACPELEPIVEHLRAQGLRGVGQSSWGPALYAFSRNSADERADILRSLHARFGFDESAVFWTVANRTGAVLENEYLKT